MIVTVIITKGLNTHNSPPSSTISKNYVNKEIVHDIYRHLS